MDGWASEKKRKISLASLESSMSRERNAAAASPRTCSVTLMKKRVKRTRRHHRLRQAELCPQLETRYKKRANRAFRFTKSVPHRQKVEKKGGRGETRLKRRRTNGWTLVGREISPDRQQRKKSFDVLSLAKKKLEILC